MKEAVEKIVKALVDEADAVTITEVPEGKTVKFQVRVASGEMGRLIGREGRTVKAIRALLYHAGQKQGRRFVLDIVD